MSESNQPKPDADRAEYAAQVAAELARLVATTRAAAEEERQWAEAETQACMARSREAAGIWFRNVLHDCAYSQLWPLATIEDAVAVPSDGWRYRARFDVPGFRAFGLECRVRRDVRINPDVSAEEFAQSMRAPHPDSVSGEFPWWAVDAAKRFRGFAHIWEALDCAKIDPPPAAPLNPEPQSESALPALTGEQPCLRIVTRAEPGDPCDGALSITQQDNCAVFVISDRHGKKLASFAAVIGPFTDDIAQVLYNWGRALKRAADPAQRGPVDSGD